jgi:hypothetical protein
MSAHYIENQKSHCVRLNDHVYGIVSETKSRLNQRYNGQRKGLKYSLSEVIEWYINAAMDNAALP